MPESEEIITATNLSYAVAWDEVAGIIKSRAGDASLIKEDLKETYRAFLDHKATIVRLLTDEMERNMPSPTPSQSS
jgi:DNA helicase TIP49 (TBP-interacting protein)